MPLYLGNTSINEVRTSIIGDSVLYTEQNLTERQKAQARENIGAISEDEVNIDNLAASKVLFEDGETFQQKYDNGELKGQDGIIGKDGAQGPAGADGYTPVKGTDYFTAADKQELVNEFIENVPVASATTVGGVKVDTSISETSTNPVQNKAIKSYVDAAVAGVVESAPETLNTLNELAAALGDDPNFATTIATQIGNKVDKIDGKGLSTNDYTTAEKEKLAGIAAGATRVTSPADIGAASTANSETWVFTLADGSTVSKEVILK